MEREDYLKSNPVERLSDVQKRGLVSNLETQKELLGELLENPELNSEKWYRCLVWRLKKISEYIPEEAK